MTLKIPNQSFHMTLCPMMMHHHTGYKRFSGLNILSRQTFMEIFNLHCDLDLQSSNEILFTRTIQHNMIYHQIKSACKRINSSEGITETVIFWSYKILLWPWPWRDIQTKMLPFMMHNNTKFGYKRFSGSGDITWIIIHWHFELSLRPWSWTQQFNLLRCTRGPSLVP